MPNRCRCALRHLRLWWIRTSAKQPDNTANSAKSQWNSTCSVSSCECLRWESPAFPPIWSQWHRARPTVQAVTAHYHAVVATAPPCFSSYSPYQTAVSHAPPLFVTPKSKRLCRKTKKKNWMDDEIILMSQHLLSLLYHSSRMGERIHSLQNRHLHKKNK